MQDTQNFVSLVKEMRRAFGSSYGISVTLPSSYWYLRWFDPKAMEPYVNFFGLMTYDLHGPWDGEVKQIGKKGTRSDQYSRDRQLNFAALVRRNRSVENQYGPSILRPKLHSGRPQLQSCWGCSWSAMSRPGPCTDFAGVMSLEEIKDLIPQVGVQPTLLVDDMMKQLTWSDQWIGHDDPKTIVMKKQWASGHCFGGTMIWSIDLYSGSGSGNTPDGGGSSNPGSPGSGSGQSGSSGGNSSDVVYIDPIIWTKSNPVITCEPPRVFILPPLVLPTETIIIFPPYVTSLEVAWSEPTGWTKTIETTTLTIPAVTTTAIPVWEYTVTSRTVTNSDSTSTAAASPIWVTSSILPPPFIISDDSIPQSTPDVVILLVTRTITPPPYPYTFTTPPNHLPNLFPVVTFKPGPPGPICKSGCGKPCRK